MDFLIEDQVILELKAVEAMHPIYGIKRLII